LTVIGTTDPGSTVNVVGTTFPARAWVNLLWDGSAAGMPVVRVGLNSSFGVRLTIPAMTAAGPHVLSAVGAKSALVSSQSGRVGEASAQQTTSVLAETVVIVATPTPSPTATPTPSPTATPTPSPTATPTPSTAACPPSLQAAINATPSGGTLTAIGCTWHEIVTVTQPITLNLTGSTDDGTGLGVVLQQGLLTIRSPNVTLNGIRLTGSGGAGLYIGSGNLGSPIVPVYNVLVENCSLDNNIQEGYAGSNLTSPVTITDNAIFDNNVALTVDPSWEAGGGKISLSSGVTFSDNTVYGNGGPGIWFDIGDSAILVSGNRVYDNYNSGIAIEIALSGRVTGNLVYSNHTDGDGTWLWGACILSSSSTNVEIDHNTVAWCPDGIGLVSQSRSDAPTTPITGLYVHDNTIAISSTEFTSDPDRTLLGWDEDWAGTMFAAGNTNRGSNNQFWTDIAEPSWGRFAYGSQGSNLQTLAAFNATAGGGGNSTYLTLAQMQSALSAAGIPITPP
jgi:hypothetical protein